MFELRVLTGLHLGTALPLFGDNWSIGQSKEADLLLTDAGVEAQHCLLRREEQHWQLQQQQGVVTRQPANLGGDLDNLSVEEPFAVGSAWLCIAAAETPWQTFTPPAAIPPQSVEVPAPQPETQPQKKPFPRWMSGLVLSLTLLFTFPVVSWMLQPTPVQTQPSNPAGRKNLATPAEISPPLKTMLRERELAQAVSIQVTNESVTLNGSLNEEQMLVFNRMLNRFNESYMTNIPLINQVKPLKIELPFRIVQITTGSHANIVTDNGKRIFIGDEVDNLRLVSITNDHIEFGGRDNIKVSW